jgi:hypothetical protein
MQLGTTQAGAGMLTCVAHVHVHAEAGVRLAVQSHHAVRQWLGQLPAACSSRCSVSGRAICSQQWLQQCEVVVACKDAGRALENAPPPIWLPGGTWGLKAQVPERCIRWVGLRHRMQLQEGCDLIRSHALLRQSAAHGMPSHLNAVV